MRETKSDTFLRTTNESLVVILDLSMVEYNDSCDIIYRQFCHQSLCCGLFTDVFHIMDIGDFWLISLKVIPAGKKNLYL